MKSLIKVLNEQFQYFYLIIRLSVYEIKITNRSSFLGSSWEILNMLIQLSVYWYVFQHVRQGSVVTLSDGTTTPFFYWLFAGFVLWMFFYKSTIETSKSIYSRLRMLSKMNFPLSIVPSFVIFSHLYIHLVMVAVAILFFNLGGFFASIYYVQLLYFIPATVFFIFSLGLLTSTLSTLLRDIHMLLNAVLRMVLYLSPILWEVGKVEGALGLIGKINPLFYLIEGYRAALFGTEWYFLANWEYSLYFWGVTTLIFITGAVLHVKFRRHFVDFL